MGIKYLDFDLLIERTANCYRARVLDSPAGEASIEFKVPFSQAELNDFFLQIGQTRSFETEQTRRIRAFGQSLFESVFQGPVRDRLRASMGEASSQSDGLRIRLRLTGAPELGNLPWEFLYDPGINRFLALSVETPLVRYLETPQMAQPFAVQPPLRILTMICGPQDFPRLDSEREWSQLQDCMQSLEQRGLVSLQRLEPPTLQSLQRQLRREQYHIFHFVGHGIFSRNDQDGYLLFEDAQRGGHRVSGHDLGTILHDHRPLRLVMLNACEGARAALDDQFAGTAQSLIQQGIPAVIAMQFRITDQASILLAREFYGALADGYPVDAALTEARKAIKTEGNDLEWGTPVLYMRSPDGRIFDIAQMPAANWAPAPAQVQDPEKAAKLNRLYTEGLEAFYLAQWETAFQKCQAIVDLVPNYKDAAEKLEIARKKMQAQALNEQAQEGETAGDWDKAIQALDKLAAADASFPEISARMANARRQAQLADLYAEARQLAGAERWQAIPGIFKEIDQLSPHYPDPDELRTQAQQHLAKARREAELESAYTAALSAFDASDWKTAIRHLRHVRRMDPEYREADQLLGRAESQMERIRSQKLSAITSVVPGAQLKPLARILVFFLILTTGHFIETILHVPESPSGFILIPALWWFLASSVGRLGWKESIPVLVATTLGQLAHVLPVSPKLLTNWWVWFVLYIAAGLVTGIPVAWISLKKKGLLDRRQFAIVVVGWCLAYGVVTLLFDLVRNPVLLRVASNAALVAFVAGGITLSQLNASSAHPVNWGRAATPAQSETAPSVSKSIQLEWVLPAIFSIFFISSFPVQWLYGMVLNATKAYANTGGSQLLFMIPWGIQTGLILAWFLSRISGQLKWRHAALVFSLAVIGEILVGVITKLVGFGPSWHTTARIFWVLSWHWHWNWLWLWAIFGLLLGAVVTRVLGAKENEWSRRQVVWIIAGWGVAYAAAIFVGDHLAEGFVLLVRRRIDFPLDVALQQGLALFMGTWFTMAQLKANRSHRINPKTVLASALGFAVGGLLYISASSPRLGSFLPYAVLAGGLIAGAALAFPSHNWKRYLAFSLAVGLAMLGAELLTRGRGGAYVTRWIWSGALVGFFLGLYTRRLSGILICTILGVSAFILRYTVYYAFHSKLLSMEPLVLALTVGVIGAILAAGWSYLGSEAPAALDEPGE